MVLIESANNFDSPSYDKDVKSASILQSDGDLVDTTQIKTSKPKEEAKCVEFREASFKSSVAITVNVKSLTEAGFYYIGHGVAQCFSCGALVENWTKYDDPFSKRWHSADCKHINSIGIGTESLSSPSLEKAETNISRNYTTTSAPVKVQSAMSIPPLETQRSLDTLTTTQSTGLATVPKCVETGQQPSGYPNGMSEFQSEYQPLQLPENFQLRTPPQTSRIESSQEQNPLFPSLIDMPNRQLDSNVTSKRLRTNDENSAQFPSAFEEPITNQVTQSTADIEDSEQPLAPTTPSVSSFGVRRESIPVLDMDDGYLDDAERASCQSLYSCQNPHSPEMARLSSRLASFNPLYIENLNPTQLATAGYFYLGYSDHVQCWYCGVEADGLTADKNPWIEHARLYPSCEYLLRNRGSAFVEATLLQESNSRHTSIREAEYPELNRSFSIEYSGERIQSGPDWLPTPPIDTLVLTESQKSDLLHESMESEIAQIAVLEMNFPSGEVRRVIKKQIDEHSCNFQSIQGLVDAIITDPISQHQNIVERLSEATNSSERENRSNESTFSANQEPRRGAAVSATPTSRPSRSSAMLEAGNEELERIQSESRCKVCLDKEACVLFRPCAHICACADCTRHLSTCPICRRRIQSSMLVARQ